MWIIYLDRSIAATPKAQLSTWSFYLPVSVYYWRCWKLLEFNLNSQASFFLNYSNFEPFQSYSTNSNYVK